MPNLIILVDLFIGRRSATGAQSLPFSEFAYTFTEPGTNWRKAAAHKRETNDRAKIQRSDKAETL